RFHFDLKFFKRFLKILKLLFPRLKSANVLLFSLLLALVLLEQVVIYFVGLVPSKYYSVLGDKDKTAFRNHTLYALLLIVSIAFIVATEKYVMSVFHVTARKVLTLHLHKRYFHSLLYYHLNVLDDQVDNPDQRITQDVNKMCDTFSQIVAKLLVSPFTIVYYMYTTWEKTGYIGPLCVVGFFAISTVFNKFLMSAVVHLVYKQEKYEGDFRYKHMQIRSNAESVAFYRACRLEEWKTNYRLRKLIGVQQRLILKEYALNFSIQMADYLGSILSYVVLAIPIFSGVYDDLSPSDLSALISENAFVTIYLISCFTRLIDMSIQVTDIAGTAHRSVINRLMDSCLILRLHSSSEDQVHRAFSVQKLTYCAPRPDAAPLVQDLTFNFSVGDNIVITGDSGCGKSSLLRVVDALWPAKQGVVESYASHGHTGIIFLPQKALLTDGSLRQQITYPYCNQNSGAPDDVQIIQFLKDADLDHLIERTGGLDVDVDWNWHDVLSPGEMQRLSFVRLFYHAPPFAVLDESTSQVSIKMEQKLYDICRQLNITVMSVGHRDSLLAYHDLELRILGEGKWELNRLRENS
ncbi:hypothetical protein CAPTEDRAFT_108590, partial [Capitella teleta]